MNSGQETVLVGVHSREPQTLREMLEVLLDLLDGLPPNQDPFLPPWPSDDAVAVFLQSVQQGDICHPVPHRCLGKAISQHLNNMSPPLLAGAYADILQAHREGGLLANRTDVFHSLQSLPEFPLASRLLSTLHASASSPGARRALCDRIAPKLLRPRREDEMSALLHDAVAVRDATRELVLHHRDFVSGSGAGCSCPAGDGESVSSLSPRSTLEEVEIEQQRVAQWFDTKEAALTTVVELLGMAEQCHNTQAMHRTSPPQARELETAAVVKALQNSRTASTLRELEQVFVD